MRSAEIWVLFFSGRPSNFTVPEYKKPEIYNFMKPSNSGHSFNVKTKYKHSVMLLCFLIVKWFYFIFQPTFCLCSISSMLCTCLFKSKQA